MADTVKGILNKANYRLGGTLPANAVKIGIYEEDSTGAIAKNAKKTKESKDNDASTNWISGIGAQQVQAQVQKGVKPVYEIGTTKYYLIDGRPQGSGQVAYIFGPSGEVISRVKDFADLCHTCTLEVICNGAKTCKKGEAGAKKEGVHFKGGTLTSFSIQATAQDFMVTGNIGFIFMDIQSVDL